MVLNFHGINITRASPPLPIKWELTCDMLEKTIWFSMDRNETWVDFFNPFMTSSLTCLIYFCQAGEARLIWTACQANTSYKLLIPSPNLCQVMEFDVIYTVNHCKCCGLTTGRPLKSNIRPQHWIKTLDSSAPWSTRMFCKWFHIKFHHLTKIQW